MNRFGKRLLVLAGVTMLSVTLTCLGSGSAIAQGGLGDAAAPELEGTWRTTVENPGYAPLEVLHTFTRGGVVLNAAPIPGQMNGQGVWTRLGPHRFGFTLEMYWNDGTGQMGRTKVKEVIEVYNNGQEYRSLEASAVDYYPDGQTASFCSTTHGKRMEVEPPDPCS